MSGRSRPARCSLVGSICGSSTSTRTSTMFKSQKSDALVHSEPVRVIPKTAHSLPYGTRISRTTTPTTGVESSFPARAASHPLTATASTETPGSSNANPFDAACQPKHEGPSRSPALTVHVAHVETLLEHPTSSLPCAWLPHSYSSCPHNCSASSLVTTSGFQEPTSKYCCSPTTSNNLLGIYSSSNSETHLSALVAHTLS